MSAETEGQLRAFLSTVPIFSDLTAVDIDELCFVLKPFTCARGVTVFRQGDAAAVAYVLERGSVAIRARLPGEDETRVGSLGPGELFGELALLDGGVRSATALAEEDCAGYSLSRSAFAALCADMRPAAFKIVVRLLSLGSRRMRSMTSNIEETLGEANFSLACPEGVGLTPDLQVPVADLDRDTLRILPIFSGFTPRELEDLLGTMHCWHVPRRRVVFRQGDEARSCYVTVRGAVQACLERDGGARKLALLGPGKLFGDLALIDDVRRSATCVAREHSHLLELPRASFHEFIESGSPAAFKFFSAVNRNLVESLRVSTRRLVGIRAER